MAGINGGEFLVLIVIALLVVGPERLPAYAEQLGTWVRALRSFAGTAKERVADELGDEAADVDWASLDPRRYDPRRIVREALLDDPPAGPRPTTSTAGRRHTTRAPGSVGEAGAGSAPARPAGRTGGTGAVGAAAAAGPGGTPGSPDGPSEPVQAPFDDEAT